MVTPVLRMFGFFFFLIFMLEANTNIKKNEHNKDMLMSWQDATQVGGKK